MIKTLSEYHLYIDSIVFKFIGLEYRIIGEKVNIFIHFCMKIEIFKMKKIPQKIKKNKNLFRIYSIVNKLKIYND